MAIEYLIPQTHTWNQVATAPLASGDTIKLTANTIFGLSVPVANIRISMVDGVTFDGQGYVITLASGSYSGIFELPQTGTDCNIQNVGVDAKTNSASLASSQGYLINSDSNAKCGNIYNCYVYGTVSSSQGGFTGGIFSNSNLNFYRCYFSDSITGFYSGGFTTNISSNFTGTLTFTECYAFCNLSGNNSWSSGLVSTIGGGSGTIRMTNCYHNGTYSRNTLSGMITVLSSNTNEVYIDNCYCTGTDGTDTTDGRLISINTTANSDIHLTNSLGPSPHVVRFPDNTDASGVLSTNDNNSSDLTEIQGQLTGAAINWQDQSDTWTAGTDSNYPTLDQFTLGPWNPSDYTLYTSEATLTENYTGGNARGSSGGGGGDPHIFPLFGKTYDLPNWDDTFLLLDNQQEDKLIVKGKCWYVPREIYEKDVETYIEDGVSKLEFLDFYRREKLTFFKYLKIEYNNEEYIFDMDSLKIKKYTSHNDLENGTLPTKKRYKKSKSITITRPMKRYQLLFSKHVTRKSKFKYSQNATAREIIIKTKNNKVTLLLISDLQKIDLRNSIELTITSNAKSFYGALIRKEIKTVEF